MARRCNTRARVLNAMNEGCSPEDAALRFGFSVDECRDVIDLEAYIERQPVFGGASTSRLVDSGAEVAKPRRGHTQRGRKKRRKRKQLADDDQGHASESGSDSQSTAGPASQPPLLPKRPCHAPDTTSTSIKRVPQLPLAPRPYTADWRKPAFPPPPPPPPLAPPPAAASPAVTTQPAPCTCTCTCARAPPLAPTRRPPLAAIERSRAAWARFPRVREALRRLRESLEVDDGVDLSAGAVRGVEGARAAAGRGRGAREEEAERAADEVQGRTAGPSEGRARVDDGQDVVVGESVDEAAKEERRRARKEERRERKRQRAALAVSEEDE